MKIAVASDNGLNVSQHFGRAEYYVVFDVQNGQITGTEKREKAGHRQFFSQEEGHGKGGGPHGFDASAQRKHASMAEIIKDCQVLIAGGMGQGAYEHMKSYNIQPVVTDIVNAEEAVKLYIEGRLPNLMDRVH
jgi:predicted Fe-Mo cluster-binding NifX family protein